MNIDDLRENGCRNCGTKQVPIDGYMPKRCCNCNFQYELKDIKSVQSEFKLKFGDVDPYRLAEELHHVIVESRKILCNYYNSGLITPWIVNDYLSLSREDKIRDRNRKELWI